MLKLVNFTPRLDDTRSDQHFLNNHNSKINWLNRMKIIFYANQLLKYCLKIFQNYFVIHWFFKKC